MTNSAGFTGAMPAMQISLPLSRSLGDIVVSSQATMKASSGRWPSSAPERQTSYRKNVTDCRTAAHSGAEFGRSTAHCSPTSSDFWTKKISRLTLRYFRDVSDVMVRAP